ncbi:MAG: cyclic nucleotide-binding domain-containing protein [Verrucomicrobiales bacterium]|nr:cyclic nucleotide-binding domain-containing protein [Verrucomicrobiales bacterium]
MNSFLSLVEGLDSEDESFLLDIGDEVQVIAGTLILEEGKSPSSLFIVLQGLLEICASSLPGSSVACAGPGAMVGDISLLTGKNASADVRAVENSLLLKVPLDVLLAKIGEDTGFGLRLYRKLACLNAERLVETTRKWNTQLLRKEQDQSTCVGPMAELLDKIAGFKKQLGGLDKQLLKSKGIIPEKMQDEVSMQLRVFGEELNAIMGPESGVDESIRAELGYRLHTELLPVVLLTDVASRMYTKPRGYAGDYLTIQKIYQDEAGGTGHLGPLIDRAFLDQPAARAVRNRRGLMAGQIREIYTNRRKIHVTSFACGPAREVFDAFEELGQPDNIYVHLLDIDEQALDFLRTDLQGHPLERVTRLIQANLVYLALGRQDLELPPQDLIYSIGLIDYFGDRFVVKLLNYIHQKLDVGGRVVVGNFHPCNPTRTVMDFMMDWRLIHRDEEDMNRLFRASRFASDCEQIIFEEAGVNLFAVGVKA